MTAAQAFLPADLELRPLAPHDAAAVAGLVVACDRTYDAWAPPSWRPPPGHEERAKWEQRLAEPDRWARGAWDGGALVGMVSMRQARDDGGEPIAGVGHLGALFVDPAR